ncbi:hypothetical protein LINPERPRIM_LOCUS12109 [Linum perenne]
MSPISIFCLILLILTPIQSTTKKPHLIKFRPPSPNLYPEWLAYDSSGQHFVVGSLHNRTIHSISDSEVIETLISDPSFTPNSTILGVVIDSINNRLLTAVHSIFPPPIFNALAAYDLRSRKRIFLSLLPDDDSIDSSSESPTSPTR